MSDFVDEYEAEVTGILSDAKLDFTLASNDIIRGTIRVDKGENLASAIGGWGAGHDGNGEVVPKGHNEDPGNGAAIQAALDSKPGQGVSTVINTDHPHWADAEHDGTLDNVAAELE